MKILVYSDLHLEFGNSFMPPEDSDADLMILAGDIITFQDFKPLKNFLSKWDKQVLYVTGNHEYYTSLPMDAGELAFKMFITENAVNIKWLKDNELSYRDVAFFGGTMWTDFNGGSYSFMLRAKRSMNDYYYIVKENGGWLDPLDTIIMHEKFKEKLIVFLEENKDKKRVIISHHAPVLNPKTMWAGDVSMQAAYNSLDMIEIIEKYQPDLWIYGHTHECDDQMVGKTRIISNPFGYTRIGDESHIKDFDPKGMEIII